MSWVAVAIGGTALIGGVASMSAADKQSKSAKQAAEMQHQQYLQTRQDLMPWQKAGGTSLAALMQMEGLAPQDGTTGNAYGSLMKPYTGASVQTDPGYQFGLNQGENAINRRASAMGSRLSPATMQALSRFNQDYAGTKFNEGFQRDLQTKQNQFGQLFGISTGGQNAATQTGYQGMNAATGAGNATMQAGNAQAAGIMGASNAITGGLQNGINNWQQQQLLDRYLSGNNYGGGAPYPTGTSNYGWQGTGSTYG